MRSRSATTQIAWINWYIAADEATRAALAPDMIADLRARLDAHLAELPADAPSWGWKEPRSIYLLPFLNEQMPTIRFLHFIRDGRDMAFPRRTRSSSRSTAGRCSATAGPPGVARCAR